MHDIVGVDDVEVPNGLACAGGVDAIEADGIACAGGVDAIEADGIACAGGMAATDLLCTEQFKNSDVAALKVAPVFPELVSTGSDGEQSLAYAQMAAPLIEAVKTLKADNDALTAELAALRRRVETLETRVNALPR